MNRPTVPPSRNRIRLISNRVDVDPLYRGVCDGLPSHLRRAAEELAFRLKLTPTPGVPWSAVFANDLVLQVPAVFAEMLPPVSRRMLRTSVMAHMLAVIEAFGADRLEERQVEGDASLIEVLAEFRRVRNRALVNMCRGKVTMSQVVERCRAADEATRTAIRAEHALLTRVGFARFTTYEQISLGKQSVGFPATVLLASVAGFEPRRCAVLERMLASLALALQYEDDVADWEDDWARGGAWAVCLARGLRGQRRREHLPSHSSIAKNMVLWSGALERMLCMARRHYRAVRRCAGVLGAVRLAHWARQREAKVDSLIRGEARDPGYAVRVTRLAPWAVEVLA